MASRADLPIPESQAIIMIENNTTPLLKSILMLSEFPSFTHLYNRARVVQNQIKDSSLLPFFEGKPKGRKAPATPTTKGVIVNESINVCSQPLRPPNKPSTFTSTCNPHQFPSQPSRPYSAVPPPSGYTCPGLKRSHYSALPESLGDIFFALMSCDAIQRPPQKEVVHPRADTSKYYPYHRAPGHEIHNCFTFHDWVYDMNDQGRINWDDVKVAIAKSRLTRRDLGIVQNPLPNHQTNNKMSTSKFQEKVNTMTHQEPWVGPIQPGTRELVIEELSELESEEEEEAAEIVEVCEVQGHPRAVFLPGSHSPLPQLHAPVSLKLPIGTGDWLEDRGMCGVAESREETPWRGAIPVGARGGFGVNWEIAGGVEAEELGVNIACRQAHQPGYRRPDPLPSTSSYKEVMKNQWSPMGQGKSDEHPPYE
ncbi:hypothetical protein Taro_042290 [Colocasia esculenta]|uniref:Uncharacterized protein n=1 Tax=Colocasia esculenta TaxID=4460 RepID=A0A843WSD9_COLES|nr:hypothetical protein [Colocasia esculenta]